MLRHWSQLVPNISTDIRGHEATLPTYLESRRDQVQGDGAGLSQRSGAGLSQRSGAGLSQRSGAGLSQRSGAVWKSVEVAVMGSNDPNSPYGLRGRKATLNWDLIAGWIVLLKSCSPTVPSRTLSLWLCSEQLLKQQLAEYASCFALAGSPLP